MVHPMIILSLLSGVAEEVSEGVEEELLEGVELGAGQG